MKVSNKILLGLIISIFLIIAASIISSKKDLNLQVEKTIETTKKHPIQAFSAVEIHTFADITILKGEPAIEFIGDSVTIERHIVEHRDSLLKIVVNTDGNWVSRSTLTIKISTNTLDHLNLMGSGNVIFLDSFPGQSKSILLAGSGDIETKFSGSDLNVNLEGSGQIINHGTFNNINVKLLGSGDILLQKTIANSGLVSLMGSGNIEVNCKEQLMVTLTGSGDVSYLGKPASVQVNKTGSGEVNSVE